VAAHGLHSSVGEVFIERDHDRTMVLCPSKDRFIRCAAETNVPRVTNGPLRPPGPDVVRDRRWNVLVE
jgi:hypothetical protein